MLQLPLLKLANLERGIYDVASHLTPSVIFSAPLAVFVLLLAVLRGPWYRWIARIGRDKRYLHWLTSKVHVAALNEGITPNTARTIHAEEAVLLLLLNQYEEPQIKLRRGFLGYTTALFDPWHFIFPPPDLVQMRSRPSRRKARKGKWWTISGGDRPPEAGKGCTHHVFFPFQPSFFRPRAMWTKTGWNASPERSFRHIQSDNIVIVMKPAQMKTMDMGGKPPFGEDDSDGVEMAARAIIAPADGMEGNGQFSRLLSDLEDPRQKERVQLTLI
ncbi:hypothetical protein EDB85DRAFT_1888625 [Lactarius pseudohatsudake]|nr:hypothetical protein EDB85DRAFT_1888625 [Lactarius pseudohatsudake]